MYISIYNVHSLHVFEYLMYGKVSMLCEGVLEVAPHWQEHTTVPLRLIIVECSYTSEPTRGYTGLTTTPNL